MACGAGWLPGFDQKMPPTRKALERIPEDRLAWRPHPNVLDHGGTGNPCGLNWGLDLTHPAAAGIGSSSLTAPPNPEPVASRAELLIHLADCWPGPARPGSGGWGVSRFALVTARRRQGVLHPPPGIRDADLRFEPPDPPPGSPGGLPAHERSAVASDLWAQCWGSGDVIAPANNPRPPPRVIVHKGP